MKKFLLSTVFAAAAGALGAAIGESDARRLGGDLTPLGAEKAGSADGLIPAWDGGLTTPPAGYKAGDHHPDPYASDRPLYTVTAENLGLYQDKVTAGHAALLKAYPDYKLDVYATHRSASNPRRIYDATRKNSTTAHLTDRGNGIAGSVVGIPFPIPQDGLEAIWNHLTRYRGGAASRHIGQAAPQRNGSYTFVDFSDEFLFNYCREGITEADLDNTLIYFKQTVIAPARLAGTILLVHETMDQVREPRRAWVYNAGRRRVTRAPNVAYDNPGTAADGQRTSDQFDMFNGAPDRYRWNLLGKKEMIVPYNSYRLHSDKVRYSDILKPGHINQDLARYELHRVWVVDATLKPGTSHLYSRRTFYIDEDSWQILAVDQYDGRGAMWRVSEAHCINYYDAQVFWSTLEVHTDLQNGRYLVIGLDNEGPMYDFTLKRTPADYSPDSLRRDGIR
ncbi:MAG: outer rane lipoproteinsorting protein [Verrucomicrobia bacterium]|nr:outer rane lipoproteinsorting protein [Verrucomicrobiota bacterium]